MGQKLLVGPINKGLRTDVTAFNIDNDSFPKLINAYQWRGRVKRKRGTSPLVRLTRYFSSTSTSYSSVATINLSSGAANILTGFSLQTNGNIVPGSVTITAGATVYTDPAMDGTLTGGLGGTINYATGAITIVGGGSAAISAVFLYYPDLPVMGLEQVNLTALQFPTCLAFDTKYSYIITNSVPYTVYDVSFYKNLPTATYTNYVAKTSWTATSWNGQDYQQFWSTNYQGAFWVSNGMTTPFTTTNIGMQFKPIVTVTIVAGGPPARATLQITGHGLVVGDFVFVNEVATTTGINGQTGYVTTVTDANNVQVDFLTSTIANAGTGGIAQYLTSRSDATKDCIRWYDGDPTNGSATNPVLNGTKGWVNFCPPLSALDFSIADNTADQYYLVGARMIVPYKDRLLFIGPVIQTSSAGSQIYLQDTVIYSQNGTPFYTCTFPYATVNYSYSTTTAFTPILVPTGQTSQLPAFWEDITGLGGFLSAGYAQPIYTVGSNEDVLIMGFSNRQTRFVYTGNDVVPFNFFNINLELGSGSTFSAVNLDRGVLTIGDHGIAQTSQVGAQRIDPQIPDQVFQMNLTNNGSQRVTAQRDFIQEWVYFTYPDNEVKWKFPNQTLQYNYRDQSWGLFFESYTTYGLFQTQTGYTWATIGLKFPSWSVWNEPWNAGSSTLLQPQVIAGNQQGFVVVRDDGTSEADSLYIRSFSGQTVTCPDHCLNEGDYIIVSGCIGTIASTINNKIFQVGTATTNTFVLIGPTVSGTYVGGGVIKRMYIPQIQTKQFPMAWEMGRKTRIGMQQYLFTTTPNAQITLQIFLSQNASSAYNFGPIVPDHESENNALVYSDILYTCPESTNLGLTPANTNLNLPTAAQQAQTWHRMNTSLIGDTVQIGFTLSDEQMTTVDDDGNPISQFAEIELHAFSLDLNPSQYLA